MSDRPTDAFRTYAVDQLDDMFDELSSTFYHAGFIARRELGEPAQTSPIISSEYRRRSFARSRKKAPKLTAAQTRLSLYGLGLSGESGEVADEIKKHCFHDKPIDREHILAECGDVIWYLDRILDFIDATFEDAMEANDRKLSERYPDGWDAADKHYDHDTCLEDGESDE